MSFIDLTDINLQKYDNRYSSIRVYDIYLDGDIKGVTGVTGQFVESVTNSTDPGETMVVNTDPDNPIIKTINKANNNGSLNNINIYGLSSNVNTDTRLLVGQGSKLLDYTDDNDFSISMEETKFSMKNVLGNEILFTRTGILAAYIPSFYVESTDSEIKASNIIILDAPEYKLKNLTSENSNYYLTYHPADNRMTYHYNKNNNFILQNNVPVSKSEVGILQALILPGLTFRTPGQAIKFSFYCNNAVTNTLSLQININGSQITNLQALSTSLHFEIEFTLFYVEVDSGSPGHGKFFHQSRALCNGLNTNTGIYGVSTELSLDITQFINVTCLCTDISGGTIVNYYSRACYI